MVSPPSFHRKGQDTPSVKREQPPTVTGSTIDRLSYRSRKSNRKRQPLFRSKKPIMTILAITNAASVSASIVIFFFP